MPDPASRGQQSDPAEGFGGTVGRTFRDSTPWWPPGRSVAGKPDVVLVVLDDVGFASLGCFGSDIDTRHMDRLANRGLRYTDFNVAPLCSATRAALLTGRNHHSVGMAYLSNVDSGFPGYRGRISHSAATVAEVLRDGGYATHCVGKWHLAPIEHTTAAGPYDQWPLSRGFNRYYGFLDALVDQYYPDLVHDNHRVDPPASPEDGYHLSEDLVDHAIGFVRDHVSVAPEQPYFLYLAFGAAHTPHQAPEDYLKRYRGRFDGGWDEERAERFARQKAQGVMPVAAELAPRNPGVEPWADLAPDEQRLYARMQEAYAGFLDHTDDQLGRLVDFLEAQGRLDNTLFVLLSDNGASQEGGPHGGCDIVTYEEGEFCTVEFNLERFDSIGGPDSQVNFPWGWAQAENTPLKRWKQNTHAGGVRTPLIISWPEGIADRGGIRPQFHHAIDVAPTILDLVGVAPEASYRGVPQMPYHGVSMRYSFDAPETPSTRTTQYFEMIGHRAVWHDGWKAIALHTKGGPFDDDPWELYHVAVDTAECHDLAAQEPEKLAELIDLWWREAAAYQVLPLDDRYLSVRTATYQLPDSPRRRTRFSYLPGMARVPAGATPLIFDRSYAIEARVGPVEDHHNGVLVAVGDVSGGYVLYLQNGHLLHEYHYLGRRHRLASSAPVAPGSRLLGFSFERAGAHRGVGRLLVDGAAVAESPMDDLARSMISWGRTLHRCRRPVSGEPRLSARFPVQRRTRKRRLHPRWRGDADLARHSGLRAPRGATSAVEVGFGVGVMGLGSPCLRGSAVFVLGVEPRRVEFAHPLATPVAFRQVGHGECRVVARTGRLEHVDFDQGGRRLGLHLGCDTAVGKQGAVALRPQQHQQQRGEQQPQPRSLMLLPDAAAGDGSGPILEQRQPPSSPGEGVGEDGVDGSGEAGGAWRRIDGEPADGHQFEPEHHLMPAGRSAGGLECGEQQRGGQSHTRSIGQRHQVERQPPQPRQ